MQRLTYRSSPLAPTLFLGAMLLGVVLALTSCATGAAKRDLAQAPAKWFLKTDVKQVRDGRERAVQTEVLATEGEWFPVSTAIGRSDEQVPQQTTHAWLLLARILKQEEEVLRIEYLIYDSQKMGDPISSPSFLVKPGLSATLEHKDEKSLLSVAVSTRPAS